MDVMYKNVLGIVLRHTLVNWAVHNGGLADSRPVPLYHCIHSMCACGLRHRGHGGGFGQPCL